MSSDPPHPALNADPVRQGVGSLKGYAYQIWRSVLEWMTMQADEAIDLEGNEDIDRLYPGGAESTQVKDTAGSGPVTLRSGDVIEAINNYWKARQRNVGVKLSMRFLSTAGVTSEKEKPFGERHGLRVWQSVQRRTNPATDEADAILLRDFLLQVPGLDA